MSQDVDSTVGLYEKYHIVKLSDPQADVRGFFLNFDCDPYAAPALAAYAVACAAEYPILAEELSAIAESLATPVSMTDVDSTIVD